MDKILLIAYYYPPLSSAATYRAINMVKYLKEDGFNVDVLTVNNIDYHSQDNQLINESNADNIYRAQSYDPLALKKRIFNNKPDTESQPLAFSETNKKIINSFFPIDNKILWFFPAYKKGLKLIKKQKYHLIIATIGPYTSALIAYYLSKKTNTPYMIDYRDHWTLNTFKFHYNYFNSILSEYYEKKILKNASLISCVSENMKTELNHLMNKTETKPIIVSYNGFNEDDFLIDDYRSINEENTCYIRYFGTFNANRKVNYFIKALEELLDEGYLFSNLKIEFYGVFTADQLKLFHNQSFKDIITVFKPISHKDAIKKMCGSDVLLLFISSKDGKGVLTSKIFEYFKTHKMILPMIRQDGEANQLIKKVGLTKSCSMEDIAQIKKYLKEINERIFNNYPSKTDIIDNYSRKKQVSSISKEIRKMIKIDNNS